MRLPGWSADGTTVQVELGWAWLRCLATPMRLGGATSVVWRSLLCRARSAVQPSLLPDFGTVEYWHTGVGRHRRPVVAGGATSARCTQVVARWAITRRACRVTAAQHSSAIVARTTAGASNDDHLLEWLLLQAISSGGQGVWRPPPSLGPVLQAGFQPIGEAAQHMHHVNVTGQSGVGRIITTDIPQALQVWIIHGDKEVASLWVKVRGIRSGHSNEIRVL